MLVQTKSFLKVELCQNIGDLNIDPNFQRMTFFGVGV